MEQDSRPSMVTPQSLQFMMSHPPPSFQSVPNMGMKNYPPPPPPSTQPLPQQQIVTPPQPQWVPVQQWVPNPMGRMNQMRQLRPMRPMGPQMGPMMGPMGPRIWRGGGHFKGNRNRFNPMKKNHRYQNSPNKLDQQNNVSSSNVKNSSQSGGSNRSANVTIKVEASSTGAENEIIIEEKKRKPMSKWYPAKPWNRQDAEKALKVELETYKKQVKTLIIRFPDPDLSWDLIKSYHSSIEKVHFQVPSGARYCFIQLSDDADVDKVISELSHIEFYNLGNIKVERKFEKPEENVTPEMIDPYTLYIGNLPLTISTNVIKEKFPTAARVDVGFAQRMKYTRYAFIRYQTVEESIAAFKASHNVMFDSRTLIVRFRRQKGEACLPSDQKAETKKSRREKRKKLQQMQHLEELKKEFEQKIKKEKKEKDEEVEQKCGLTLSEIIGDDDVLDDDDQESEEEEEKEVDDDDDEDDDDDDNEAEAAKNDEEEDDKDDEEEDDEEEEDDDEDDEDDDDEEEGDDYYEDEDEDEDEENDEEENDD